MSTWTHERARVASLSRSRADDDPELVEARHKLQVARFEEHIRKLVDSAPPISDEMRNRLALLLRGGGGA